jgi:protein TonB
MRDWVAKVERVGELNYPDAARRQNLSGKLIVQVALYPDGSVREITIRKPSGHKILDDAAVRIVKLAAPFAPFPENIRAETGILYITRTWVFTSSNRLRSR